ncbi:Na+/H+ antiporter subunit D [Fluviibacterium sp. DFM31]|uniref:Na+/H+ antiporter subunit D n=1 Tax=Meridianimarinicoccus marinus TaxID=3231483 RepID=A0ABV3L6F7_9RHOB
MIWILVFPLMIPFVTAVLSFLYRDRELGRWIAVSGSALAVLAALALMKQVLSVDVVAGQMGEWAAPFGITLVADRLSAIMVLLTAISGLAVTLYATAEIDQTLENLGFHAILQILLGGVTGAFLTGDLFNLYVWFEVMLISSFGLLILGGERRQIDGAVKYVTLNLVSTVLFLSGIGLLYGVTGTLNMADLRGAVAASDRQGVLTVISVFFLIAFCMKAAAFPLFSWLPASYHTPTFAVSAIFAGLLTKVGVYSLLRLFTLIFDNEDSFAQDILIWVAVLTMVTGVLGALAQTEVRRILSYQIISSIGFLLLGLAIGTPLALAGAIFYLMHNIIVKVLLFLVAGVMERLSGGSDLRFTGGLYKSAPLLAVLFLIPAFSLAGFPPLSGFWAKVLLVKATLDVQAWVVAGVALAVGLLTIYSMTTIWAEAFWKAHPDGREPVVDDLGPDKVGMLTPIVALCGLSLILGFFPQPFITLAEAAAAQLLDPSAYLAAVLGETAP